MVSWRHGGTAARWRVGALRDRRPPGEVSERWETVTVYRHPDELVPEGRFPAPLDVLGAAVELRVRPAPGGRGTELAGRLRARVGRLATVTAYLAGDDPRLALRCALRQAKQLAETGEVLCPDRPAGPALHRAGPAPGPPGTAQRPSGSGMRLAGAA